MKITNIQFHFVEGEFPEGMKVFTSTKESRRVSPTDIHIGYTKAYEQMLNSVPPKKDDGKRHITSCFLEITTDDGIVGRVPATGPFVRERILQSYAPILMGMDPLDNEMLWDIMYRTNMNGYTGIDVEAISACDTALWDIKAKAAGMSLNKLLGGTTQPELPAYFNCLGYSYEPEVVAETIKDAMNKGFKSTKWVSPAGPGAGEAGMQRIELLIRTIRETAGPDFLIMMDCSCSWDYDFAYRMVRRLEKYDMFWLEEPLLPHAVESYAKLVANSPVKIALGEHLYTRYGFKQFLDKKAAHIYQPDPVWCGGLTETLKIVSMIIGEEMPIAFHGAVPPVCTHLAAIYPKPMILAAEYLDLITPVGQHFYKTKMLPVNGSYQVPTAPGIGIEIDMDKVSREWYQDKTIL